MRQRNVSRGVVGLFVSLAAVLALAGFAVAATVTPHATPTTDIVGTGLVNCAVATGEVGYSPASIKGGTSPETVSIWFQAKKCSAASSTTSPVPISVIGSMSFSAIQNNGCPQLGKLGTGILNLTYNYPPVPVTMIDPSVASTVTVTQSGPYWDLSGAVTAGSYPDPSPTTFTIDLKPNAIGGQNCGTGITSEYIIRAQGLLTNI